MRQIKDSIIRGRHLILDGDQTAMLYKIFSGLLPHANYDGRLAARLQRELFSVLPIEEVFGENYLFYTALVNIDAISLSYGTISTGISKEGFTSSLEFSLSSRIRTPEFDAELYFEQYGKNYILDDVLQCSEAVNFVYDRCLEVYDEIFDMAIQTSESITYISNLAMSLKSSVIERSMRHEALALEQSYVVAGHSYSGPDGVLELRKLHDSEIQSRFINKTNDEFYADCYESVQRFQRDSASDIRQLAYFGYDPVDALFPLRSQDIVSVIADEGVGKTKLIVDWVHTMLMSGCNVLVVCGETAVLKFYKMLQLNHISYITNISISIDEFDDRAKIPHSSEEELEEINIQIDHACYDLASNEEYGRPILKQNLTYEGFYDFVKNKAIQAELDIVVVDHVAIMDSDGGRTTDGFLDNDKRRIDFLYRSEDRLTKEMNLAFINTVHLQNDASSRLQAGKKVGVRIAGGSSSPTKYASIVCLLHTTDELERQSILLLEWKKVRDYKKPPTIALYRDGATSRHHYNAKLQNYATKMPEDISAKKLDMLIGEDDEYEEEESYDTMGFGV